MVPRVIVDMASAHILLDTPYPVHQARRARLDPAARTLFVAGIGVYALTFSRRLIMEMDRERLVAAHVRHHPGLGRIGDIDVGQDRSVAHTYELQALMRRSYSVFCLNKQYT